MLNFIERKEKFTMKRLALFIGGLLVLPAFAEVAPIFYSEDDTLEYADVMYDENGFLIIPDEEVVEDAPTTVAQQTPVKISRSPVNATPVTNRTTASRVVPTSGTSAASGRGSANGNSSRVVAARTTTNASPRSGASRTVASRGTTSASPRTTTATGATSTRTTTNTAATRAAATRATGGASRTAANGATVARTGTVARTATSGRTTSARTATTTAGAARAATTGAGRISIRSNEVGAKGVGTTATVAGVAASADGMTTLYNANRAGSTGRMPTIRMASLNTGTSDATSITTTTEEMDDLAELTDYCKAQYASCMDNYCNVLDDNQGRCSCSANLKSYAKSEAALKSATEELQDVAQKIQYIGLTTREVETLFSETEAEETMRTKGTDNSVLKSSLDKVKNMIIDVKSGGASSMSSDTGLNFDLSGLLEFSFDSTGFDLGSLFGTTNANSVSNQRGEELYKTATARCKTSVLKACTARGVDASLITNAYDLEIDRECMAYERSLNDSNDQMLATVRNAKSVLQKARLMVAQQKNSYDMRGCINALDACMQDEFVCGSDYENCLDPTGRYIVNGEIVVGSQPGHAIDPELSSNVSSVMTSDVCRVNLYRTWDFEPGTCTAHTGGYSNNPSDFFGPNYMEYPTEDQGNAWGSGSGDNLVAYIETTVSGLPTETSENMSKYLQNKIGYNKDSRNYGMCMSVLNKCQDYTYTNTNETYNPKNDVIKQYLGRILVQIKAKQDEILANYAETCVSDVTSCLSQNGYPSEEPNEWVNAETARANIAVNACRAQVVTCMSVNGYSIETPTPTEMNCWVQGLLFSTLDSECARNNVNTNTCSLDNLSACNQSQCNALSAENDGLVTWCTKSSKKGCKYTSDCTNTQYTVTIDCNGGVFHRTAQGSGIGTLEEDSNGCVSLTQDWCTLDGGVLLGYDCEGDTGDFGQYCPNADKTCTAIWKRIGGGETPSWLTVNLNNGAMSNAIDAVPNKLYVDRNSECVGVFSTTTETGCPAQAITNLTSVPRTATGSPEFKWFDYNGNGAKYIASTGAINSSLFKELAQVITAQSTSLTAQWDVQQGKVVHIVIDRQGGESTVNINDVYVRAGCDGFYTGEPNANCGGATRITNNNVGAVSRNTNERSYGYIMELNDQDVLFAKENGQIEIDAAMLSGANVPSTVNAVVKYLPANTNYVTFDTTNGTWQELLTTPSVNAYDIYTDFDIEFYACATRIGEELNCQNTYSAKTHYNYNGGYSPVSISMRGTSDYTLRGYYPTHLDVTSVNATNGNPWPRGNIGSTVSNMPSGWVLAMPVGTNFDNSLKLYGAYAKNCSTVQNGSCSLSIDNNGYVTYTTNCDSGYTLVGSGANMTCVSASDDPDYQPFNLPN